MKSNYEITVCMGSSCFSRGGNKLAKVVIAYSQQYPEKKLKIEVKGSLCTGNCEKGPVVKINNKIYTSLNEEKLIDLLDKIFL